jgi:hypothetical protein
MTELTDAIFVENVLQDCRFLFLIYLMISFKLYYIARNANMAVNELERNMKVVDYWN